MQVKKKPGRPPKLTPDAKTLKLVYNLGRVSATSKDCAAFLDVTEPTWIKFKKDNPKVAEAYASGMKAGAISLRMAQMKLAVDGQNATMQIWLGKQLLGQRDHKDIGGPGGGPIPVLDLSNASDEQLAALEAFFTTAAGAAGDDPEGDQG